MDFRIVAAAVGVSMCAAVARGQTFQTLVTEPTPDMPLVGGNALAIGDGGEIAFEDGGALFYYDRVSSPQLIDAEMDSYNISLSGTSLLTYEVSGQLKQWNGSEINVLHSSLDAPKGNYHSVNVSGQVAWNSSISHASAGMNAVLHTYTPGDVAPVNTPYDAHTFPLMPASRAMIAPNGTAYYIDNSTVPAIYSTASAGAVPLPASIEPIDLLGANNSHVLMVAWDQDAQPSGVYLADISGFDAPLQLSTSADVQAGAVTPGGRAVIADQDLTNQTFDVAYFDGTQVKRLSDIFDTSELWLTGSAPMINDNDAGIVIVQGYVGPSFAATILAWDTVSDAYSIIVQAGQLISVSDSVDPVEVSWINFSADLGGTLSDGFSEDNELVFSFGDTAGVTRIVSTVPEPTMLGFVTVGMLGLLRRRR